MIGVASTRPGKNRAQVPERTFHREKWRRVGARQLASCAGDAWIPGAERDFWARLGEGREQVEADYLFTVKRPALQQSAGERRIVKWFGYEKGC